MRRFEALAVVGLVAMGLGVVGACGGSGAPAEPSLQVDAPTPEADADGPTNPPLPLAGDAASDGRADAAVGAASDGLADAALDAASDGRADAAAEVADATADPAVSCDGTQFFSPSVLVPGFETIAHGPTYSNLRLTPDELRVVYTTANHFGTDLVEATRASRSDAFGPGRVMNELHPDILDPPDNGMLSPDGLHIYFDAQLSIQVDGGNPILQARRLFTSQRADVSLPFDPRTPVAALAYGPLPSPVWPKDEDVAPYLVGTDLWFSRFDTTRFDIFHVSLVGGGAPPVPEPALNVVNKHNYGPVVSADGLTVFFTRGDAFGPGAPYELGAPRIMEARRPTLQAPFCIRQVAELNTVVGVVPHGGIASWLSPDGCRLYFTSESGEVRVASRCGP